MPVQRLKHFGWGREGEGMSADEIAFVLARARERFGVGDFDQAARAALEDLVLPAPRIAPPAALAPICSTEPYDRAAHTYGKAYVDYVRGHARRLCGCARTSWPIRAARRRSRALIDWAGGAGRRSFRSAADRAWSAASSRASTRARYKAAITIDLRDMGRVLEVDRTSRAARIEGGAFGPALEAALQAARPHAAPFPAELRVFDPGRLDRDALGRAFRDALHAYRRSRRMPARGDAAGRARDAPAARLGRRAEPRPACSSARKASSASSPRPGCGSRTGRASVPAARCASRISSPRRGRCA